jgi:hypothetical protein
MTTSSPASIHPEAASHPSPIPPPPWMPLGPLTELWAAFGREATNHEALLAASEAFAALAEEREAIRHLNWVAPVWSPALDLDALIRYTLSQRVRVWAIAHSLLAEQMQHLSPQQAQQGEEGTP